MRDHRDEHPGCKAMWPWLKWCSRYRYASQLVGFALEDIKNLSNDTEIDRTFELYNRKTEGTNYWKHRSDARAKYIQVLEGWDEEDRESTRFSAQGLAELKNDPNLEEGIYQEMMRMQRVWKATHVLYAYGMFNTRTGKIEVDRIKKLR